MGKKETKKHSEKEGASLHTKKTKALLISTLTLATLVLAVFLLLVFLDQQYAHASFPGVTFGSLTVSGKSEEEIRKQIEDAVSVIEQKGISVTSPQHSAIIESVVATNEIDTAFPLFSIDAEAGAKAAYEYGRSGNGLKNSWNRLLALLSPHAINVSLTFDQELFESLLKEEFSKEETPAKDSHLSFNEQGEIVVSESSEGSVYKYAQYSDQVRAALLKLQEPSLSLALVTDRPDITAPVIQGFSTQAKATVAKAPFTATWEEKSWDVSQDDVKKGLDVRMQDDKPALVFTEEGLSELLGRIKKDVDIEAKDSKFSIENDKVTEFQSSQKGRTVDVGKLLAALTGLIQTEKKTVTLTVVEVEPDVTENDGESLGITEQVAKASTNFKGSPTNRRKNIANGVRLLTGTLIKPGETFSLVKALSPIEKSNGYLPELVIKGNRTIPEVGGGLCQIGTTAFRVVLKAGLPVVERKNHSYRVSYYEPPVGMDATIYDPKPDFRFTNDYPDYLLLLARVEGDELIFEFWGTKDGRVAESSTPKMYNVTSPGPTKYIETDELSPGEQKCIEKAHNGASAEFTYTVTYPNGDVKSETFYSKYKAWQAVCLVGKAQ